MWPNPQSKPQFPLQCICNSVPLKIPYPRCLTGPQIYPHKRPPHVFCKTRFIKFTEKQLCWSLFFNKVVGLKLPETCNFIQKKRLQHSCFLCEFCKSLKYTFFTENFPAKYILKSKIIRNNRLEGFCKKVVLKHFANFTGDVFFSKVPGLSSRPNKKQFHGMYSPANFVTLLITATV